MIQKLWITIEIIPEYRGLGLTKKIIDKITHIFINDINYIGLHPFPLQHKAINLDKTNRYGHRKNNFEIDTKKLVNYYAKMGFVVFKNSNVMYKEVTK